MGREELDAFIRQLPGVSAKELKSRTSYWRADGTRFCKLEGQNDNALIVFTDMWYAKNGHVLKYSEPDHKGRIKLRLTNSQRIEDAKMLIMKRYT